MKYTVYKVTNIIDGKIYIGVHKTDNLDDGYMGSGKHLRRAIEKHGIENFTKEYVAIFDNSKDMFNMESELVNEVFVKDKNTYNLKEGGFGGYDYINKTLSPEKRREITRKGGLVHKERLKNDKKYKEQFIQSVKGHLPIPKKGDFLGDKNGFYGKKHTSEAIQKMSGHTHQQGKKNSQYGTCWIYCPYTHENKKIPRFDLKEWEDKGWVKGRKQK